MLPCSNRSVAAPAVLYRVHFSIFRKHKSLKLKCQAQRGTVRFTHGASVWFTQEPENNLSCKAPWGQSSLLSCTLLAGHQWRKSGSFLVCFLYTNCGWFSWNHWWGNFNGNLLSLFSDHLKRHEGLKINKQIKCSVAKRQGRYFKRLQETRPAQYGNE